MAKDNNKMSGTGSSNTDRDRFNLAKWTILFVFGMTLIIGAAPILIIAFGKQDRLAAIKDILGILLPVLTGWAGIVLAYYFSQRNYESAAQLVRSIEEKLKSIQVKDVMIAINDAETLTLKKSEDNYYLKNDIIDAILDKTKKERLPILDKQGCMKYMSHRSLINKFIVQEVFKGRAFSDIKLSEMVQDPDFKPVLTGSFKTLLQTSNLEEAKKLMGNTKMCSDVFATEDGTVNTSVVGWVTNVIIEEQSKIG